MTVIRVLLWGKSARSLCPVTLLKQLIFLVSDCPSAEVAFASPLFLPTGVSLKIHFVPQFSCDLQEVLLILHKDILKFSLHWI